MLPRDHTVFRRYLLFISENYRGRQTSHYHFSVVYEIEKKPLRAEMSSKVRSVYHENLEEFLFLKERVFYRLNQRIVPKRYEDIIFHNSCPGQIVCFIYEISLTTVKSQRSLDEVKRNGLGSDPGFLLGFPSVP